MIWPYGLMDLKRLNSQLSVLYHKQLMNEITKIYYGKLADFK